MAMVFFSLLLLAKTPPPLFIFFFLVVVSKNWCLVARKVGVDFFCFLVLVRKFEMN
jgi:hypothetical protein